MIADWTDTLASSEDAAPRRSLAAALLGFFIITLDALVVSVALPAIRTTFGGGITLAPPRASVRLGRTNRSRQVGGATAVAAFGALVAAWGFDPGTRTSLAIAGALLTATMLASLRLRTEEPGPRTG